MRLLFVIVLLGWSFASHAFRLSGHVEGSDGLPVAYASVFVKNSTYGVATNLKGNYYLELDNGNYTIVFQAVGYEPQERSVTISGANQTLSVVLPQKTTELEEVSVVAGKKDPAYAIMKKAIENRKRYQQPVEAFRCTTYVKASMERDKWRKPKYEEVLPDSLKEAENTERMNLYESYGIMCWQAPQRFKEIKLGVRDIAEKQESSVNIAIGDPDGNNYQSDLVTAHLFKTNLADEQFNFYESTMSLTSLGAVPFMSPLSPFALTSYKFRLVEAFHENGRLVNKIEIIPRRKEGALVSGFIYIHEDLWNIKAIDVTLDASALYLFKTFRVVQEYDLVQDSVWMVSREELYYNARDGADVIIGQTVISHSDYDLNPNYDKRFFNNELRTTVDEAFDRDSTFWDSARTVTLKEGERKFIHHHDSVEAWHASAEYLAKEDSAYNRITFWDFVILGVGHRNSFKKQEIYFEPLLNSMLWLGVGGYRHAVIGHYKKEWDKAHKLDLSARVDYGFNNQDFKGWVRSSYLYNPKRFGRLHMELRNSYEMVNLNKNITAVFGRGNYVNDIFYEVGHEIEIANGLLFDVEAEFGEKRPIDGLTLSEWSQDLFGADNQPQPFDPYSQLVLDIKLKWTPGNKYYTAPYKKVNLGSKWPQVHLNYRHAFPDVFGTTADFDFIEIRAFDDMTLGTIGDSKWNLYAGSFVRDELIYFTDERFFRGSDRWIFSNPLKNFQLLGPTLSTKRTYLQGNYMHRFNGVLMNKVPLLRKLKLQTVAGTGVLLIEDQNFRHLEVFAGLELPFRIRRQLFKVGVYYITADSNHSALNHEIKFGIDFFNSFTNSWSY